jgi:hypothetical protein
MSVAGYSLPPGSAKATEEERLVAELELLGISYLSRQTSA